MNIPISTCWGCLVGQRPAKEILQDEINKARSLTDLNAPNPWTSPVTVTSSYLADGVKRIVLRSRMAKKTKIIRDPLCTNIVVTGFPREEHAGKKISDSPKGKKIEEPWTFFFDSKKYNSTLIVSVRNESEIQSDYELLDGLQLQVPSKVQVVLKRRYLSGGNDADLSPYKADITEGK
jgi:hypothetical protein